MLLVVHCHAGLLGRWNRLRELEGLSRSRRFRRTMQPAVRARNMPKLPRRGLQKIVSHKVGTEAFPNFCGRRSQGLCIQEPAQGLFPSQCIE